jgi:CBS domain-containing protein
LAASELIDEPRSPKQEFAIAVAGPLTSLGLGVLFTIIWLIGNGIGYAPLAAVGGILATVNVALAIFNLLPGFPLDGGRIFRSLIWRQTGSLEQATRYAATGGRILGGLLVAFGIAQILFARLGGGLWLILIGFFLYQSAGLSYFRTMSQLVLRGLRVRDLMRRDFMPVSRNTRVRDLLRRYVRRRKKTAVVVEPDRRHRAGVLDVTRLPDQVLDKPVGELVPPKNYTLTPGQTVIKALDTMMSAGILKLPVTERGKLVGILTAEDIQAYIAGKSKLKTRA